MWAELAWLAVEVGTACVQELLEFIFPAFCLHCKAEGAFVCARCIESIVLQKQQCCPICSAKNRRGEVCEHCQTPDFYLDGLMTASAFEKNSVLQHAIHELKYNFIEDLATPLADILLKMLLQVVVELSSAPEKILLCPIPLHKKRLRFRGFNQAELLAKQLIELHNRSPTLSLEFVDLLDRIHFVKPQMGLSREKRIANAMDAFSLKQNLQENMQQSPDFRAGTIILIDDVATTLSTLNNCAKALKMAGVKQIYGLVLARVF